MNDQDIQEIFDTLNEQIPAPQRRDAHRAALLEEANRVSSDVFVRLNDQKTATKGKNSMKFRYMMLIAAILVLAGATLASQIIDLIVPGDDDTRTIELFYDPAPMTATPIDTMVLPTLDPANINSGDMPYTPIIPEQLTERYELFSSEYFDIDGMHISEYRCPGNWGLYFTQTPITDEELEDYQPLEVGASAEVITVDINGAQGQYVRGFWVVQRDDPLSEDEPRAEATMVWNNDIPFHELVWIKDGFIYNIHTSSGSTGEYRPTPCELTMEELVEVAIEITP